MKDFVVTKKFDNLGRVVIPKEMRTLFDIKPGDSVILLCDKEKGIALVKSDFIEGLTDQVLGS